MGIFPAEIGTTYLSTHHVRATDLLLERQVECLWKLDEVPCATNSINTMSKEDRYALI